MQDEQAVILRAQRGDPEAFGVLVQRYQEPAFRVAYLLLRDEAEAQDVAQDAFVRAYRSLDRFDTRHAFRPWLLRIVTNLAINNRRSARRRDAMTERYERSGVWRATAPSPEVMAEAIEESQRVWHAVGRLDMKDQALLYLRYFVGASEEETAAALGRPVGTVKSRAHRALRRLRDLIASDYPDLVPGSAQELRAGP